MTNLDSALYLGLYALYVGDFQLSLSVLFNSTCDLSRIKRFALLDQKRKTVVSRLTWVISVSFASWLNVDLKIP